MTIVEFTEHYLVAAKALEKRVYEEERKYVKDLPEYKNGMDLTIFIRNDYSVVALEGNELVGYFCSYPPFDNAFRATEVKGAFSPMGANAAIKEKRDKIYLSMYQFVAERWVKAGAVSHAICLPAHDEVLQKTFFRIGFGLRCIDSIRDMEVINYSTTPNYEYMELPSDEYSKVYPLDMELNNHYKTSYFFMNRACDTLEEFTESVKNEKIRFFVACQGGDICAYYSVARVGETYICDEEKYIHIYGAYCKPQYRGKGIAQNLLNFMIVTLRNDGYSKIGVDFESINPTGYGFWMKYFTPYTHSVVRRIDENILKKKDIS